MILALCTCCYVYLIRLVCRLSTLPLSPLWSWVIRPGAVIHHLKFVSFLLEIIFLNIALEILYITPSHLCAIPQFPHSLHILYIYRVLRPGIQVCDSLASTYIDYLVPTVGFEYYSVTTGLRVSQIHVP